MINKSMNLGLPGNPIVDTGIAGHPVAIGLDGEGNYLGLLAIAAELRTANLIAAANSKYADGSAMFPALMGVDNEGLVSEIKSRLGQK